MIKVGKILVSDDLVTENFICDLEKCKGACCVEGESGAPLDEEELPVFEKIYKKVKPYLTDDGIKAIEEQGLYVKDSDDDWVTPLMWPGGPCAYTIFEKGIAYCGIEKAWRDGKIKFQKPVSCHLYPIRIEKMRAGEALNYHRWELCSAACKLGKKKKVRVYEFLKTALIRKYGEKWYDKLVIRANEFIESMKL
ncbi:MAG: DUF3109 family protein [Bacteroidetes bacterium]|nr:DUF3109 family protein [Bacteroidota bacterium]